MGGKLGVLRFRIPLLSSPLESDSPDSTAFELSLNLLLTISLCVPADPHAEKLSSPASLQPCICDGVD